MTDAVEKLDHNLRAAKLETGTAIPSSISILLVSCGLDGSSSLTTYGRPYTRESRCQEVAVRI